MVGEGSTLCSSDRKKNINLNFDYTRRPPSTQHRSTLVPAQWVNHRKTKEMPTIGWRKSKDGEPAAHLSSYNWTKVCRQLHNLMRQNLRRSGDTHTNCRIRSLLQRITSRRPLRRTGKLVPGAVAGTDQGRKVWTSGLARSRSAVPTTDARRFS